MTKIFDPKTRGLVVEESKPEANEPSGNAKDDFKRLDTNEDGVLSGVSASVPFHFASGCALTSNRKEYV